MISGTFLWNTRMAHFFKGLEAPVLRLLPPQPASVSCRASRGLETLLPRRKPRPTIGSHDTIERQRKMVHPNLDDGAYSRQPEEISHASDDWSRLFRG